MEETLIQADVGINTSLKLVETLRTRVKERKLKDASELKEVMKEEISKILTGDKDKNNLLLEKGKTNVILVVGSTE